MPFDLSAYDHLVLDMNGTFVLDFDNFGAEQDYGATYEALGYTRLNRHEAHRLVSAAYDHLAVRYVDDACVDAFPGVPGAIRAVAEVHLDDATLSGLVDTFAQHELGHVPPAHERALRRLSARLPLSVLSNLWAPRERWDEAFADWGITELFEAVHFSSDGDTIKPSPTFFAEAIDPVRRQRPDARILYVGDSYRCDVLGAQASGIDAVWLNRHGAPLPDDGAAIAVYPDLVAFEKACDHAMSEAR